MNRNTASLMICNDSQNMGEKFAISVLRDQKFLYNENFTGWKFTRFNGTICEI